jgi:hypothetical protein
MKSHLHSSQTVLETWYKMLADEKSLSFLPGLPSVFGNLIFMNKNLGKSSIKGEYILFRDVEHSGSGSAPESVPTNSYHTRNQLLLIRTDSRNRLQFRPISRCINSPNSVRFRNRMIIVRFPYSTTGTRIQLRNGIPEIASTWNCTKLPAIPGNSY